MAELVLGVDHVSVLVQDTRKSLDFYRSVLGLEVDPQRPELGYPGAWLRIGTQAIHLIQLPSPDPVTGRPAHGGHDRHIALFVSDLNALRFRLDVSGIAHTVSRSGRKAVFCRDPDGNALEFVERKG
ncbi:MAG: VOC family protein [Gammaproteobacteria bacterium]|jgi:glyoxylase I family protein|nr:VOC family protein [Gammaproteobacteria bacterium]